MSAQCRCVVWIISSALQIHCNPRVLLGDNKLVSNGSIKTDHRGLQELYLISCNFCILVKSFPTSFELKQLPFPWSVFDLKQWKMIEFEDKFLKGLSPF